MLTNVEKGVYKNKLFSSCMQGSRHIQSSFECQDIWYFPGRLADTCLFLHSILPQKHISFTNNSTIYQ